MKATWKEAKNSLIYPKEAKKMNPIDPSQLQKLHPLCYLYPSLFKTNWPVEQIKENRVRRFRDAYSLGKSCLYVSISISGVWSAVEADDTFRYEEHIIPSGESKRCKIHTHGASIQSFEKIGYHANTFSFWAGILRSHVPIVIYRDFDPSHSYIIQDWDTRFYGVSDDDLENLHRIHIDHLRTEMFSLYIEHQRLKT